MTPPPNIRVKFYAAISILVLRAGGGGMSDKMKRYAVRSDNLQVTVIMLEVTSVFLRCVGSGPRNLLQQSVLILA